MFIYEYEHSVDAKGRVSVPAAYRDELGENFCLTVGFDGCLDIFPADVWDAHRARLMTEEMNYGKQRKIQRKLFRQSINMSSDKQGRILLPEKLRKHAEIEKEVVFIGMGRKIELWSKKVLDRVLEEDQIDYDEMSEILKKPDNDLEVENDI